MLEGQVGDRLAHWEDGRIKLYVTATALHVRRRWRKLFLEGTYTPLVAALYGSVRTLTAGAEAWGDTRVSIPDNLRGVRYRNALTGDVVAGHADDDGTSLRVSECLRDVPATMLYSVAEEIA